MDEAGVVVDVGRRDREQRLVIREGIHQESAVDITRGRLGQTTGPCRDGAVGITGLLGPHGRQVLAQARQFRLGHLGDRGGHAQRQRRRQRGSHVDVFHIQ